MSTLTITTTAAQDVRLVAAVGKSQGLGRDATPAEAKAFVIQLIRQLVQQQEWITAQQSITNVAFDPT